MLECVKEAKTVNKWIELKAAAARLLYNNDRSAEDYKAIIDCIELCERQTKALEALGIDLTKEPGKNQT